MAIGAASVLKGIFFNKKALAVYIVIGIGFGLYFAGKYAVNEYTDKVNDLAKAETRIEELAGEVEQRNEDIKSLHNDIELQSEIMSDLARNQEIYNSKLNELRDKLTKDGRDIGKLMIAKPGMMERILNRGSNYRMRCFELAAGAKPNEDDKENNVCPQFIPDAGSSDE